MEGNFRTELKNLEVDINALSDYLKIGDLDVDTSRIKATIEWNLEAEAREYGIKSIAITATKVTCEFDWSVYSEDITSTQREQLESAGGTESNHETFEGSSSIDSTKLINGKGWEIKEQFCFKDDGQIYPENVEIDLINQTITIS